MIVRKALFSAGYRFRLHRKDLPGKPDIVLPGRQVVIFIHGCFWHAHQGCRYAKIPETRRDFWKQKLASNISRDQHARSALLDTGWRVLTIWECATRSCSLREDLPDLLRRWIETGGTEGSLEEGKTTPAKSGQHVSPRPF